MTAHDIAIYKPCAVIDRAYKDSQKEFFMVEQRRVVDPENFMEQPPRMRFQRIHPSCPGGVIAVMTVIGGSAAM